MDRERWRQVESLFLEAEDLPSEERGPMLDRACAGDAELREQVETLLRYDAGAEDAFVRLVEREAAEKPAGRPLDGTRLGAYRVIREIGGGGTGVVYLAERDDDEFRKQVAIKVVRRGMDTADVLRRFRHERQILAGLEHRFWNFVDQDGGF